jgi:hypothetical protein
MVRTLFILFIIASCNSSTKTQLTEEFFSKSAWFASNKDSLFFKGDTVSLVQYLHTSGPNEFFIEDEADYFDSSEIVRLVLWPNHDLRFSIYNPKHSSLSRVSEICTWKYNSLKSSLEFYRDGKMFYCFKPLSMKGIKVKAMKMDGGTALDTKLLYAKRLACR